MAEAALADEWVINGDRVALQRRVLRLGKPPRRWKRPSWAAVALREPLEVWNAQRPTSLMMDDLKQKLLISEASDQYV